jgi:hypothetical protein
VKESVRPTLTRESLADRFEASGVRPEAYALYGAHSPESFVMDHRPQGWVVFYTERGDESSKRVWATEAEACQDLMDRVTAEEHNYFDLVAGPARTAEAEAQFAAWLKGHGVELADLAEAEWKADDVPWVAGEPYSRRYFVRRTTIRRLQESETL